MNCDGYSSSALMGNWVEERDAYKQPSRLRPGDKLHREANDITYVSSQNQLKSLNRISRVPAWDTSGVVLSQGFNQNTSEYKGEFLGKDIQDYQDQGDLRPIRKTTSVEPNARDKTLHCHTSGPNMYRIMNDTNADQQYVKSRPVLSRTL